MKLKIMGYTEEMELTVSGELQGLIVHKENDCFILEFLEESRHKNGAVNNSPPEGESRQKK